MSAELKWTDPRTGRRRTYWVLCELTGRTYYSFDLMAWHRTFKAAALAC